MKKITLTILIIISIIGGFITFFAILPSEQPIPDTRTVEEIKIDLYKNCIQHTYSPINVEICKNYLK